MHQNVSVRKKSPDKNAQGSKPGSRSPKRHVSLRQDKDVGVVSQEVRLEGGGGNEVDLPEGNFN